MTGDRSLRQGYNYIAVALGQHFGQNGRFPQRPRLCTLLISDFNTSEVVVIGIASFLVVFCRFWEDFRVFHLTAVSTYLQ